MKYLILALVITLIGCAANTTAGIKEPIIKTENHDTRVIRWVRISNFDPVCKNAGHVNSGGCASLTENVCTIYAPEPTSVDDTIRTHLLGHEVMHCFYGKYHQ